MGSKKKAEAELRERIEAYGADLTPKFVHGPVLLYELTPAGGTP